MKKIGFFTVMVLALSITAFGVAFAADEAATDQEEPKILAVGMQATDLKLKNSDGQMVDLANEMKGKKRVIVFMNTACSACKTELSHVQNIVSDTGSELIIVAVDFGDFQRVLSYKENNRYRGTWYQDEDFNVPAKFGFNFTPALVVLDEGNKVVLLSGGYSKRKVKEFEKNLRDVL